MSDALVKGAVERRTEVPNNVTACLATSQLIPVGTGFRDTHLIQDETARYLLDGTDVLNDDMMGEEGLAESSGLTVALFDQVPFGATSPLSFEGPPLSPLYVPVIRKRAVATAAAVFAESPQAETFYSPSSPIYDPISAVAYSPSTPLVDDDDSVYDPILEYSKPVVEKPKRRRI